MTHLLVKPLLSVDAKKDKLIKCFARHDFAPETTSVGAIHDMIKVIMVSIAEDATTVEAATPVIGGPAMQASFDCSCRNPGEGLTGDYPDHSHPALHC